MTSTLDPDLTLTPAEQQQFNKAVTTAGLDPTVAWATTISLATNGTVPANNVTTRTVTSLQELKQLTGLSDDIFQDPVRDSVFRYPAPILGPRDRQQLSASDLANALTLDQHRDLKKVADLFVFGNSARVTASAPVVEALNFPLQLNIVAAQSLELEAGVKLSLGVDPWLFILGSLSIGSGAQIVSTVDTVINVQVAFSAN